MQIPFPITISTLFQTSSTVLLSVHLEKNSSLVGPNHQSSCVELNTAGEKSHIWVALLNVSFRTTDLKWSYNLPQKPHHMFFVKVKVAQSCPTLSDPKDCSLPGSSVHGIFQARVLEWGCHCLLRIKTLPYAYSILNALHK